MGQHTTPLDIVCRPAAWAAEHTRVICRFFRPGDHARNRAIAERILALPAAEAAAELEAIREAYAHRHRRFDEILLRHFRQVAPLIPGADALAPERQQLLGAYFSMEYPVESAALYNPSIVAHPDQTGAPAGRLRIIVSLRAIGPDNISSIVFRSGTLDADGEMGLDPVSTYLETPAVNPDPLYDRQLFELKLNEMNACNEVTTWLLERLPRRFTQAQLLEGMERMVEAEVHATPLRMRTFETMEWVAHSNYEIDFDVSHPLTERVIFPVSEDQQGGIEDARFVLFTDDDGAKTYYATYTARSGEQMLPQLMATRDFCHFKMITLNGRAVQNRGMALFPRKIGGQYLMVSRQDGENLHIMSSDHLHFWQRAEIIQRPQWPWEFVQLGNCGSPLETEAGWLLLTHGVGPLRRYCIGALLLDRDDPARIVGRLDEPLLAPGVDEHEGYLPNVVYSCGALIHNGALILPHSLSDARCAIASIPVARLLDRLRPTGA